MDKSSIDLRTFLVFYSFHESFCFIYLAALIFIVGQRNITSVKRSEFGLMPKKE